MSFYDDFPDYPEDWGFPGRPDEPEGLHWDAEQDSFVEGEAPEPLPWPVDGWYYELIDCCQPLWTLGLQAWPPWQGRN